MHDNDSIGIVVSDSRKSDYVCKANVELLLQISL